MTREAETLAEVGRLLGVDTSRRSPIEIRNTDRETLADLFYGLGFVSGAEIGVERGLYSETLCEANPRLKLLCVDAWRPYRGYRDHVDAAKLEMFYRDAMDRLRDYDVRFDRRFSLDAVKDVPDASLDFVYIDAAHDFQNCTNDIAEWGKKVRPGGIIAGHDYSRYRWPNQIHVVQAVNGWTDAHEIKPWFLLGASDKVPGERRDNARSWFWVQREPRPVRSGPRVHQ